MIKGSSQPQSAKNKHKQEHKNTASLQAQSTAQLVSHNQPRALFLASSSLFLCLCSFAAETLRRISAVNTSIANHSSSSASSLNSHQYHPWSCWCLLSSNQPTGVKLIANRDCSLLASVSVDAQSSLIAVIHRRK